MTRQLLFAHGAGAPSSSDWMRGWTRRLAALGAVHTFDYPYARLGRKRPDPLPALVAAHAEAADALAGTKATTVYLGKSMGGRIGCHLALARPPAALVCFGYPLRAPSGKTRDAVLLELTTPILFLQGTRDPLCPLELLADVRARMRAPNELVVVDEGDHSLVATRTWCKRQGKSQDDVDGALLSAIAGFLERHAAASRVVSDRGPAAT